MVKGLQTKNIPFNVVFKEMLMKLSKKTAALLLIAFGAMFVYSGSAVAGPHDQGFLGVYSQTIDVDLKEAFDLEIDHGVIIKEVTPDSPAERAGIKQGDVILSYDGEKLLDSDDLFDLVRSDKPGDDVELVILRKGSQHNFTVELGDVDDFEKENINMYFSPHGHFSPHVKQYSRSWRSDNMFTSNSYIGVELSSLSEQLGDYFGVDDGEGALITSVMEDSPAMEGNLMAGDVIVKIDNIVIEGPSDVQQIIREAEKGDNLAMTVIRDKNRQTLNIEVGENDDFGWYQNTPLDWEDHDFMFFAPRMKGLFRGNFDSDFFDGGDDNDDDDGELRREIDELKKMIQELKQKVDQ